MYFGWGLRLGRTGPNYGGGGFAPLRLFALGEQGTWYDPSDLTTLYQGSAGTTPVTAHGQPVGLMLDKRRGLVLGPELVTNGGFDGNQPSSAAYNAIVAQSIAYQNNRAEITVTNAANIGYFLQSASALKAYKISFEHVGGTSTGLTFSLYAEGAAIYLLDKRAYQANSKNEYLVFTPAGTTGIRIIPVRDCSAGTIFIDNISARELPGNHALQPTAASRPLYKVPVSQIDYDGIDDVLNITFPASLGSNVTIARAIPGVGAQILTGQTVGTTYADNVDHAGLIIVNRALTAAETANVTSYLNAKAGV